MVARILDEAARLFETLGYVDTTTNHVANAAGVSIGSLYQYFPNKDSLLVGLAERHLDEVEPRLVALAQRLNDQQLTTGELCRRFILEIAELNKSTRLHNLLWTAPRTNTLAERISRLDEILIAEIAVHLRRLGHPPNAAPLRARVLVSAIYSGIHRIDSNEDVTAQIDELIRLATAYVSWR